MIKRTRDFLRKSTYLSLFFLCLHIAGLVSSIDAVMSVRTSQGAIAWVISLNTFPSISLPAYWVFGRSEFKGYVISRQADETALSAVAAKAAENKAYFVSGLADRNQASRVAESLADLPHLKENSTELLIDGEATFESILGGIEKARDYVLVQFFIVKDDELGRRLQDLLIKKAQQGVRVFFLYDEVGSYKLPEAYIQELRNNGVAAHNFHSRKGPKNRFQINFRNHRKVVVVDGRVAWIGGHNVGDEYLGKNPKFGHWRDTHVRIEGPAVLEAQLSFFEDWTLFVSVIVALVALFFNVVLRYGFNYSLAWSEELVREVIIYTTFIGCCSAVKNRSMIKIDASEPATRVSCPYNSFIGSLCPSNSPKSCWLLPCS